MSALKTKTNESGGSKLNSTLKFNEETCKLSAKLEAAIGKIKELKLKNHVLEKEQVRIVRKEKKMKESLY